MNMKRSRRAGSGRVGLRRRFTGLCGPWIRTLKTGQGPFALSLVATLLAGGCAAEPPAAEDRNALREPARQEEEVSYPKVQAGPHLGRSYARVDPAGPRPAEGWPVILLLHGAGERGDDPSRALTWRPRFPQDGGFQAILVAPQCRRGQRWVEVDWRARRPADPLHTVVDPELDFALACLDEVLAGDEGDRDRVHAVGLSMGGFGTWHLGAVAPERFASFTPICGGGQPRMAERYGGRRLFVTHGDADRVVPLVASTQMLQALAEVGVEAERILFEGVGHAAWTPTFASERWRDWLAEGKR